MVHVGTVHYLARSSQGDLAFLHKKPGSLERSPVSFFGFVSRSY